MPDNAEDIKATAPYVRGLLIVVIVLGVLLVGGGAVVISTIIHRINNPANDVARPAFAVQNIAIGTAKLVDIKNGETQIILHLEDDDGVMLVFVDPRTGAQTGRLRLQK